MAGTKVASIAERHRRFAVIWPCARLIIQPPEPRHATGQSPEQLPLIEGAQSEAGGIVMSRLELLPARSGWLRFFITCLQSSSTLYEGAGRSRYCGPGSCMRARGPDVRCVAGLCTAVQT